MSHSADQEHGVGGTEKLFGEAWDAWFHAPNGEFGARSAFRGGWHARDTEVERLRARCGQLERALERIRDESFPVEQMPLVLRRIAERALDDHGASGPTRYSRLEAAAKKAVSSFGDPYHECAIALLGEALGSDSVKQ